MADAWAAPPVERTDPGRILGERQALEAWLDFHRDTVLHKCAGMTAAQLKGGRFRRPGCPCLAWSGT